MSILIDASVIAEVAVLDEPERGVNRSRQLIDAINREHLEIVKEQRRSLERARRIGELLNDLKPRVGHGNWKEYVERFFVFTPRTAQLYMKLARGWDDLERVYAEKSATLAHLSLQGAMYVLTHGRPYEDEGVADKPEKKKREPAPKPKEEFPPLIALDPPSQFCCPWCLREWHGDPLAGQQKEEEKQKGV